MKEETRVRRCPKCANNCPLDQPKCETGRAAAEKTGVYETVSVPEPGDKLKALFRKEKYK